MHLKVPQGVYIPESLIPVFCWTQPSHSGRVDLAGSVAQGWWSSPQLAITALEKRPAVATKGHQNGACILLVHSSLKTCREVKYQTKL